MIEARTLQSIQILRAIAALAVVVFHATSRAGHSFNVGQAGVDVFFVISGFIMWVVRERGVTAPSFIADRFFRIAPIYWLATGLMLLGALIGVFPNLILSAGHVAASFLFLPYPSPNGGHIWPLLVQGWTLNCEAFFYALFAAALCLPRCYHLAAICSALSVLVAGGFLFAPSSPAARFYTDPILLEFAAGIGLGACWLRGWVPGCRTSACLFALGLTIFALQAGATASAHRAIVWGAPAVLVVAGALGLERAGMRFTSRTLLFLGSASYSIYLFHTFGVSIVGRLLGDRLSLGWESIVSTLAGICAGVGGYLLLEKPLVLALNERRKKMRLTPAPIGSTSDPRIKSGNST